MVRTARIMIKTFFDREAARIFEGNRSRKLPDDIQYRVFVRLHALGAASALDDLRIPPGNHLEALKGNRKGQHSVRISERWRICFRWVDGDAYDVEIVDYH